jgi:hypothetical protein
VKVTLKIFKMYVPEKFIETFRDGSLCIKRTYGLDGPRSIPGKGNVFFLSIESKMVFGFTKPPIK